MTKKQKPILFAMGILFIVLLLTGCTTAKRKAAVTITPKQGVVVKESMVGKKSIAEPSKVVPPREYKITKDVQVFKDLQQIDLDGDGIKEIIAIYNSTVKNLTGVKVIEISNDKVKNIIFKKSFITPNVKFELRKGTPVIIVKEKEYLFGLGVNKIYCWNGKSFGE